MSTHKTNLDTNHILVFVQKNIDSSVTGLEPISGGEASQAFGYSTDKEYVIRIQKEIESFQKDKFAYKNFASADIPIPEVMEIGTYDENYVYAVSVRANGKNLDLFDDATRLRLLPQLLEIHAAMKKIPITHNGYGHWDGDGKAEYTSWKDYVLRKKDAIYDNWEELFNTTFLERGVVKRLTEGVEELVQYLPEQSYLVHGDYGGNNAISDGEKITGIVDWGDAKYGDFVYDAAWMDFWSSTIPYKKYFKEFYDHSGVLVDHYDERVLCYQFHLGLGAIGFFAFSNQRSSYEWTKKKLLDLIDLRSTMNQ